MDGKKMLKLAALGAISAVLIDHFLQPTLRKSVGL